MGAGPIGIELAVALKKRGIDYLHFDAKQIGYTISWFPPQTKFFSSNERIAIAGVPLDTPDQNKASREQYLAYLRTVVREFALDVRTYEPIIHIDRNADGFVVTTSSQSGKKLYRCKRLVLATGGTDHPRRLNIPGDDLPHVSHYFREAHDYFGKNLLIVGGKNSAVESALRCHHAGRSRFDELSARLAAGEEHQVLAHAGDFQFDGGRPDQVVFSDAANCDHEYACNIAKAAGRRNV